MVATHPVFVLGMVTIGPVPMLMIGQAVIFANRPKTKSVLAGNAAVYGVFLVGRIAARARHRISGLGLPE